MNERFWGEIVLPGVAHSVTVARHCVGAILMAAGHVDVDDVRLVASELVSNAVLHTASGLHGGVIAVEVASVGVAVARVEVTDDGADTVPQSRAADNDACTGRGLLLVEHYSTRWGVRLVGGGRRAVWAEVLTGQDVRIVPNALRRASPDGMTRGTRARREVTGHPELTQPS
ncbi:ATP-binding protein [Nonomuraea sp. NEAU-A123]|uniref:ATP-binding protein n=1 Tax=Nonomuraea sp. NEAU-A123 TaxID=2839649 RepID=UPI0027DF9D06|nr:ATP-binding protein [Nonomuraea sp. NEAU-A123]